MKTQRSGLYKSLIRRASCGSSRLRRDWRRNAARWTALHKRHFCRDTTVQSQVSAVDGKEARTQNSDNQFANQVAAEKPSARQIVDDYASLRRSYDMPKNPVVLAHGLLGFAELKLAGHYLPTIHYWHGICDALTSRGAGVITATVPPSGSIEQRATALSAEIAAKAKGHSVNIIAHSMGGLDARYLVSCLRPPNVDVKALVTVSTPHHGSAVVDHVLDELIGPHRVARLYDLWERTTGLDTGAFVQLTQRFARDEFNPKTPDDPNVRYFSYGAAMGSTPSLFSPFRHAYRILKDREGPNDGLVSVQSSNWGTYKGTLLGVNHLDLINWSNRARYAFRKWTYGEKQSFNAIAFYLDIADMLAKEGL